MRLLFLTPQLPYPPQQGTTLRNFNLIAGLSRRHHVYLLSFLTPDDDPEAVASLHEKHISVNTAPQPTRTTRQRVWNLFTSSLPDMAHRLASPRFEQLLKQVLHDHEFDVIEFEGIEMIPYLPTVLTHVQNADRHPLLVFDDHNAEYLLQKRVFQADVRLPLRWPGAAYSFVQWQRLRRYEAWACRQVDAVIVVSESDAAALRRIVPEVETTVVPNGVDIAYYASYSSGDTLPPHSLVFTGKMDFRPNVDAALWFADRVLPLIRARFPNARFYIVGQKPHPRLERLRSMPGIVITGRVPDVRPYIGGAAVYTVPLRSGGGTRLKVLEAMAMRRPIVSTTVGCDGFPVHDGREVLLADSAAEFAKRVIELLQAPERGRSLGKAAFAFARQYDWSAIVPLLEEVYARGQDAASKPRRAARSGAKRRN